MNLYYRLIKVSIATFSAIALTLLSITYAAPININRADVPMIIDNLSDIGPVKATAIVEYRELNGPFKKAEDLLAVKGIGEKTLEKNRDNLLFEDHDPQKPRDTSDNQ